MERMHNWIDQNAGRISSKVRVDPVNVIHLPSFVLGCSVMITVSLLGPLLRMFLGGILLTMITLLKYVVIIGGITACIIVLTTKNNDTSKELRREQPQEIIKENICADRKKAPAGLHNVKKFTEIDNKVELVKDDFESIKYYDIPKTKSEVRSYPEDNAYNKFINRAALNDIS